MSQTRQALGWGVGLITFGVVLLLRNLEVLPATMAAWPWAVIAAGAALLLHPAARRVSDLTLPVVLLVVGGLFALRELGALAGVPAAPVVLIAAGAVLLVTGLRSRSAPEGGEHLAVPRDDAASARVMLGYGAGTLRVTGGADDGLVCAGDFTGGVLHETRRAGERLDVTLRHPRDLDRLFWNRRPLDWDVALASTLPLDLEIRTGASRVHVDLADVAARSLVLKTGASEVDVTLPARGQCHVDIDAGAAEVRVHVPEGVAAAVRARSALATVDVDQARFPRSNGGYRSPGYDTAENRAEIDIEGGVASFKIV